MKVNEKYQFLKPRSQEKKKKDFANTSLKKQTDGKNLLRELN